MLEKVVITLEFDVETGVFIDEYEYTPTLEALEIMGKAPGPLGDLTMGLSLTIADWIKFVQAQSEASAKPDIKIATSFGDKKQ